jgi:hypothetical protein
MKLLRKSLGIILTTLGCWSLIVSWQRFQLPYNVEGRYFDDVAVIVYHQQSASVFLAGGFILCMGGLFLIFLGKKN